MPQARQHLPSRGGRRPAWQLRRACTLLTAELVVRSPVAEGGGPAGGVTQDRLAVEQGSWACISQTTHQCLSWTRGEGTFQTNVAETVLRARAERTMRGPEREGQCPLWRGLFQVSLFPLGGTQGTRHPKVPFLGLSPASETLRSTFDMGPQGCPNGMQVRVQVPSDLPCSRPTARFSFHGVSRRPPGLLRR